LLAEARRRHRGPRFVAADARALPFGAATVSRVRVDRVVQHLDRPHDALTEWRRVLRPGGVLTVFEPDLTTARIDGLDPVSAAAVLRWRTGTRPGAGAVRDLAGALAAAGFADVRVDAVALDLDDLQRADGMMGLPEWGESAGAAGFLAPQDALRWRADAVAAAQRGTLRYSCTYLHGRARAV
jgi:SAM-dependent methyltransferase